MVSHYPLKPHFTEDFIQVFFDGIVHKLETTFGNAKAAVLADKLPECHRIDFNPSSGNRAGKR